MVDLYARLIRVMILKSGQIILSFFFFFSNLFVFEGLLCKRGSREPVYYATTQRSSNVSTLRLRNEMTSVETCSHIDSLWAELLYFKREKMLKIALGGERPGPPNLIRSGPACRRHFEDILSKRFFFFCFVFGIILKYGTRENQRERDADTRELIQILTSVCFFVVACVAPLTLTCVTVPSLYSCRTVSGDFAANANVCDLLDL